MTIHCMMIQSLWSHMKLFTKGGGSVDIVVDNADVELVMNLTLADYLIASNIASTVIF